MALPDKLDPNIEVVITKKDGNIQVKYNGSWFDMPSLDEIIDINEGQKISMTAVEIRYLKALYKTKNELGVKEEIEEIKDKKEEKQKVYVI